MDECNRIRRREEGEKRETRRRSRIRRSRNQQECNK